MTDHNFVHLHVHTEYSLLDGLSQIDRLVERAKALGMPALAITDHGTMFGVMDFYRACKAAGIKPIIGVEAYLAPRSMRDRDPQLDKRAYHLLLLAKDQTGYKNLLKIASAAQLDGYYYRPRIDTDFLQNHAEGLIATSGCLAAQIPTAIMDGKDREARDLLDWYLQVFGKENFFVELQNHNIPELTTVNQWLVDIGKRDDVQFVATNDVHYVLDADYEPHDTLLCIQTSSLVSDPNRLRMSDNSYFLTSAQQMWQVFGHVHDGAPLKNTLKIAEMCEVNLDDKAYHLPIFPVPEGYDSASYLRHLCEKGLAWRYGSRASEPELRARLDRELTIINDMGFNTYFLIVWDLCQYARHADIWWNVRGSGAGSLAAYCLGITNIDPIQNNLLFERFLNPGRVSMPDIDMDFPDDRRGEMIAYAARKYGEDKVAAIITFGTMGAKASVRDVGRALGVELNIVNQAARLIPTEAKQKPLEDYVNANPELLDLYTNNPQVQQIIDTAKALQGVSRHASTHAAGVIVADKPLVEYLPLHRITGTDPSGGALKQVTQFPMETCESIGLLKIDFLGLSTLTIMRKACELIERYRGIRYTMDNIPYRHEQIGDDPKQKRMLDEAFVLIGSGETVGVFQVESSGMQQMLREMRPTKFEHIIAAISLYRPGPMEFIPAYNMRLHGKEAPEYKHPKLQPILAETFGIIVYQEQLMQIAGSLFGYELGEADLMRRAVSKKKEKDLMKHKAIFKERGPANGVDEETAEKIFADIEFFANYGFNKSHAADYAVITVQTAYLKRHYPEEYMTALLTVHRDDSAKIAHFLEECRRLSIPILPPDVNYSMVDFDIQQQTDGRRAIRFGLAAVKNAGVGPIEHLLDARAKEGPFKDLQDFCRRVDLRLVQKRTLESLVKVGALAAFGNRQQLLDAVDRMLSFSADHHRALEIGQMSLFGGSVGVSDDMLQNLPPTQEASERQMLNWEKELLGLYVTGRPADKYREQLRQAGTDIIYELKEAGPAKHGKEVRVAGEVVTLRKLVTQKGQMMGVAQIEDWHETAGSLDVVLFPKAWEKYQELVEEGQVILVSGKFDASRGDPQIVCESVRTDFTVMTAQNGHDLYPEKNIPIWADETLVIDDLNSEKRADDAPAWVINPEDAPPIYDEETGEVAEPVKIPAPEAVDGVAPATRGGAAVPIPAVEPQMMSAAKPTARTETPFVSSIESADYWLVVHLERSGDEEMDRRRLRRLHAILTSYPGEDRFSIAIGGAKKALKVEFPNHTTRYCNDLLRDLSSIVGDGNVEVFPRPE